MEQLRLLIQERFWNIVLLFVMGGFLATAVELILIGHVNGPQLIAVYSAVFGALVAIHGLIATQKTRYYLAGIFLFLCIMGLIGTFEHFGARKTKETMALVQQITAMTAGASSSIAGSSNANGGWFMSFTSPPIMAPLSLSGLSFLGMFTLFVRSNPSRVGTESDDDSREPSA